MSVTSLLQLHDMNEQQFVFQDINQIALKTRQLEEKTSKTLALRISVFAV